MFSNSPSTSNSIWSPCNPWPHSAASWPTTPNQGSAAPSWPPSSHPSPTASVSPTPMSWPTPQMTTNQQMAPTPHQGFPHHAPFHGTTSISQTPSALTSPSTSTVEHFFGQPSELQSPWSTTTPSPSSTFPPTIPMTTTHQQIPQQTPSHASVCVRVRMQKERCGKCIILQCQGCKYRLRCLGLLATNPALTIPYPILVSVDAMCTSNIAILQSYIAIRLSHIANV